MCLGENTNETEVRKRRVHGNAPVSNEARGKIAGVESLISELCDKVVDMEERYRRLKVQDRKFKEGDKVYHRNLELYGTFLGYAWESDEECDVEFETEYGLEQKHVSVSWLSKAHKM